MKKIGMITLVILLLSSACRRSVDSEAGSDPVDLLPVNDDISGFQKKGSPAIMTDYQSIMDAIDGAAQKYIDYGFIEGVQQLYSNGSIDIDVHILNQGTEYNAEQIFIEFKPSSPEEISSGEGGLPHVLIEHALLTGYSLFYQQGNIFMEIIASEKTTFALNMLKQFYLNIDGKIESN
jgi:hypothetical protein